MKFAKATQINERHDLKSQIHSLDNDIQRISHLLQGRVRFGTGADGARGENIEGRFQVFTTNATPDTEDTVAHGMATTPIGWILISIDKGGVLYKGTTAWDSTNAYFKCTVASAAVTVFLLK